ERFDDRALRKNPASNHRSTVLLRSSRKDFATGAWKSLRSSLRCASRESQPSEVIRHAVFRRKQRFPERSLALLRISEGQLQSSRRIKPPTCGAASVRVKFGLRQSRAKTPAPFRFLIRIQLLGRGPRPNDVRSSAGLSRTPVRFLGVLLPAARL